MSIGSGDVFVSDACGESPAYVKEQLGHSSIKITVDTYGN